MFSGHTNRFSNTSLCGFCHSLLFSNDDSLLFFGRSCGGKSSIECSNFSGKSGILSVIARKSLFLSCNDCLFLLFNNGFLLCGSFSSSISSIELIHFSLESSLLCSFSGANLCGFCHCLLFGNDNSLLFFGRFCSGEGSIECGYLSCESGVASITAGKTLFLRFNDCLFLLFNNGFLLCGSFSSSISSIELIHFSLKLSLLCSSCGTNRCGLGHCLLLGKNNSLLFFGSSCGIEGGIECGYFSSKLIDIITVNTVAALLCFNDSLLFSFDNSILFFLGLCRLEGRVQSVHFGLELNLLFGQNRSLLLALEHGLLFGLNNSVFFLGRLCCCKSGVERKDFCLDILGRGGLGHTLLLCLDDGLLLNVENSSLFVLGLCSLQCGIECIHIRLELHLILGLDVCLSGLEHCALFSFDDSLLFFGSFCRLHCFVEFNDFSIDCTGGRGVGCKNLLFGFDDGLLFFGRACCCKSCVECHDLCLNLSFSFFGSESYASILTTCNDAGGIVCGSGSLKSLLLCHDLSLLFALDLSIDLSFGKSSLDIFFLFGSLSGIHSHLQRHNVGLNLCHLCGALVCLLLELGSFFFSLLLFLEIQLHLLATNSAFGKGFALVRIQNLLSFSHSVVGEHRSHRGCVGVDDKLVFIFISKLGLNVNVNVYICRGFLIAVHQHVLNTADDVGGVVDQVCNDLYRGKLFRRHGDHIHLALGGDGQKANGNYADTGSAATAKVFLSALFGFCGQIQATGSNTHRELGNRNNHHTARGNDLLTYNGVRINNRAHLVQRIADYFLDRRFVFHNE